MLTCALPLVWMEADNLCLEEDTAACELSGPRLWPPCSIP